MSSMEQVTAEGSRCRCESVFFDEVFDGHPGRVAMVRACHAEKAKHPGPPKGLWNLRRIMMNRRLRSWNATPKTSTQWKSKRLHWLHAPQMFKRSLITLITLHFHHFNRSLHLQEFLARFVSIVGL